MEEKIISKKETEETKTHAQAELEGCFGGFRVWEMRGCGVTAMNGHSCWEIWGKKYKRGQYAVQLCNMSATYPTLCLFFLAPLCCSNKILFLFLQRCT